MQGLQLLRAALRSILLLAIVSFGMTSATETLGRRNRSKRQNVEAETPPFYLNIHNAARQTFAPEYLTTTGETTPTPDTATAFHLTNYGGLSTASTPDSFVTLYLSTNELLTHTAWSMSPSLYTIWAGLNLTTTDHGEVLTWESEWFDGGKARFCQGGDASVNIIFKGEIPIGCELIDLVAYGEK